MLTLNIIRPRSQDPPTLFNGIAVAKTWSKVGGGKPKIIEAVNYQGYRWCRCTTGYTDTL